MIEILLEKICEKTKFSDDLAKNIEIQVKLTDTVYKIDIEQELDKIISELSVRIKESELAELERDISELINKYLYFNEESDDVRVYKIQKTREQCKKVILATILNALDEIK